MSAIVPQLRLQFALLTLVAGLAIANVVQRPSEVRAISPARAAAPAELPRQDHRLRSYKLTPDDARKFVESVLPAALDFDPLTARQHQQDARGWCKPAAARDLYNHFYRFENVERDSEYYTWVSLNEYSIGQVEPDGSVTVELDACLGWERKAPGRTWRQNDWLTRHLVCNVVLEAEGLRLSRVRVTDDTHDQPFKSSNGL